MRSLHRAAPLHRRCQPEGARFSLGWVLPTGEPAPQPGRWLPAPPWSAIRRGGCLAPIHGTRGDTRLPRAAGSSRQERRVPGAGRRLPTPGQSNVVRGRRLGTHRLRRGSGPGGTGHWRLTRVRPRLRPGGTTLDASAEPVDLASSACPAVWHPTCVDRVLLTCIRLRTGAFGPVPPCSDSAGDAGREGGKSPCRRGRGAEQAA
jgi:hypothetical protein